jgi:DNA-binding transcriptional LysR family regulator
MLTLDDLRFVAVVAQSTTLAAAARELDVTPPAVTQRLRQIEDRLKVRLVDRSTRRLVLTDEGELVVASARPVLEAVSDLEESLASRRGAVAGHLRVVAPFGFGRRYVAPVVSAFQQAHPEVTTALTLLETPQKLPPESWDVLVHVG